MTRKLENNQQPLRRDQSERSQRGRRNRDGRHRRKDRSTGVLQGLVASSEVLASVMFPLLQEAVESVGLLTSLLERYRKYKVPVIVIVGIIVVLLSVDAILLMFGNGALLSKNCSTTSVVTAAADKRCCSFDYFEMFAVCSRFFKIPAVSRRTPLVVDVFNTSRFNFVTYVVRHQCRLSDSSCIASCYLRTIDPFLASRVNNVRSAIDGKFFDAFA